MPCAIRSRDLGGPSPVQTHPLTPKGFSLAMVLTAARKIASSCQSLTTSRTQGLHPLACLSASAWSGYTQQMAKPKLIALGVALIIGGGVAVGVELMQRNETKAKADRMRQSPGTGLAHETLREILTVEDRLKDYTLVWVGGGMIAVGAGVFSAGLCTSPSRNRDKTP